MRRSNAWDLWHGRVQFCKLSCAGVSQMPPSLVTRTARHLLAFACDAGAPALANFLLPSASVGCSSPTEVVAAVNRAEHQGGSTLLHRALRSGSVDLIDGLLSWGERHTYLWQVIVCALLPHSTIYPGQLEMTSLHV
jgi:hypothetical protein